MTGPQATEAYQIIWLVRRLFRALSHKSNELLAGLGISAAERAVMEFLYPDREMSVPEIAARYQVTRQHIQVTINALQDKGLVAGKPNPRHRRSPLLSLTARGRRLFNAVLSNDDEAINALFAPISKGSVRITRQTLQALLNALTGDSP